MNPVGKSLKSLGKIVVVMYGITAVLLFLLAFMTRLWQWNENIISLGISFVYVITCFLGGFFAGKVQRSKKYLWGILIGACYVLTILAVTLIAKKGFEVTRGSIVLNWILCLSGGMLGGMIS